MTPVLSLIVWQYLLLQLCPSSPVFLQTLPRKSVGIQGQKQEKQGNITDMSGRFVSLDSHAKEESWYDGAQEIHCQVKKRKR